MVGELATSASGVTGQMADFPAAGLGRWVGRDATPRTHAMMVTGGGQVGRPQRSCAIFTSTSRGVTPIPRTFVTLPSPAVVPGGTARAFLHFFDVLFLAARSRSLSRAPQPSSLSRSRSRE